MKKTVFALLILLLALPALAMAEAAESADAGKAAENTETHTLTRPDQGKGGECSADTRNPFEFDEGFGRASCSGSCNATSCSCSGSLSCCIGGCVACWEIYDAIFA